MLGANNILETVNIGIKMECMCIAVNGRLTTCRRGVDTLNGRLTTCCRRGVDTMKCGNLY